MSGWKWMGGRENSTEDHLHSISKTSIRLWCVVFGSAANKLDNIQYPALRLCLDATWTTPTSAEMGEMPLKLKRIQLFLNYWVILKGHEDHPTQDTVHQNNVGKKKGGKQKVLDGQLIRKQKNYKYLK